MSHVGYVNTVLIWLPIELSPEHHWAYGGIRIHMAYNYIDWSFTWTSFNVLYACMYKRLYPHILCVSHIHKSRRELLAVKPLRKRNSLATEESTRTTYHCVHITYMYMCILVYPYIHLTKNNEERHTQHSESTGIISKDMRTMLQYTFTVRMQVVIIPYIIYNSAMQLNMLHKMSSLCFPSAGSSLWSRAHSGQPPALPQWPWASHQLQ